MRLYLDVDTASALLVKLLRKAGHDVQIPADVGLSGESDPVHLTHTIADDRVCVTKHHDDFLVLHHLVRQAQGHYPGIFVVRQDNDPTRDLTPKGIVSAIRKVEKASVPIHDEFRRFYFLPSLIGRFTSFTSKFKIQKSTIINLHSSRIPMGL